MECGEPCAIICLIKLMLMWCVDSWGIHQLLHMELWAPWGKPKVTAVSTPLQLLFEHKAATSN